MQNWWIDSLDERETEKRRTNSQRDWELLWDPNFIYAGCNGGIGSDINRLEEIIVAATQRLDQYKKRVY